MERGYVMVSDEGSLGEEGSQVVGEVEVEVEVEEEEVEEEEEVLGEEGLGGGEG